MKQSSFTVKPDLRKTFLVDGAAAFAGGDVEKAIRLFQGGKKIWKEAIWDYNLGVILAKSGRNDEAIAAYDAALEIDPKHGPSLLNKATVYFGMEQFEKAAEVALAAAQAAPDSLKAWLNYVNCLLRIDSPENRALAKRALRKAIAADKSSVDSYMLLLKLYEDERDFRNAIDTANKGLKNCPESAELWNHLGTYMAFFLSDWEQALECYNKAVRLKPEYWGAVVNRGIARLTMGDMGGFEDYAHRFKIKDGMYVELKRDMPRLPLDKGPEEAVGKRLLVWGDQGIGDIILYSSTLRRAAEQCAVSGGALTFEVNSRLAPLYRRSFPDVEVVDMTKDGENLVGKDIDSYISGLDLAGLCWRGGNVQPSGNYLIADPVQVEELRASYSGGNRLVIGLGWRSANVFIGKDKSIALDAFKPLFDLFPDAVFINLQFSAESDEILKLMEMLGDRFITDPTVDTYNNLDRLAAQIAACDFVVSVSNTNVHLAGALGVPTYLMVNRGAGTLWYWHDDGKKETAFYSSVKKFYKDLDEPWDVVVNKIVKELGNG